MKFIYANIIRSLLKVFCLSIISFLLLTACNTSEDLNLIRGNAKIRVINASPDNSSVSFSINDSLITPQPLNFGDTIPYSSIPAGTLSVSSSISRNPINRSNIDFFFSPDKNYTFFIAGKISQDSLVYVTTEDDLAVNPDTLAKVRFINLSPNSTYLDVIFSTKPADSVVTFTNINFKSGTNYKYFKPGGYHLKFRTAGKKINLVDTTGITIIKGKAYTIWAKGLFNQTGGFSLKTALLRDN